MKYRDSDKTRRFVLLRYGDRMLIRVACGLALVSSLLLACSSTKNTGPECTITGLYNTSAVVTSGNCAAGMSAVSFQESADGKGADMTIQGATGACSGALNGCKWTASCSFVAKDATTSNNQGTLQYSYTFTDTGFSGTEAATIPPSTSLPKGCSGEGTVTGTRK